MDKAFQNRLIQFEEQFKDFIKIKKYLLFMRSLRDKIRKRQLNEISEENLLSSMIALMP